MVANADSQPPEMCCTTSGDHRNTHTRPSNDGDNTRTPKEQTA